MDLNSAQESHLRELLDALRPGSDDLSRSEFAELAARLQRDPQFKEVAARSQRLDLAIGDAMHDLPIPAGSVDRLLARLDVPVGSPKQAARNVAAAAGSLSGAAPTVAGSPAKSGAAKSSSSDAQVVAPNAATPNTGSPDAAQPDPRPHFTRPRRMSMLRLIEVGALATLAGLAAIAYLFTGSPGEFNTADVVAEAEQFAMHDTAGDWRQLPANPLTARLSRFVASGALTVKPTGWREVTDLLGRNGVAYELRNGAARATLYVVELDPPSRSAPRFVDLLTSPPPSALNASGNTALSAWSQGGLLYVLVVEKGPQQYKAFVAQGQLAAL